MSLISCPPIPWKLRYLGESIGLSYVVALIASIFTLGLFGSAEKVFLKIFSHSSRRASWSLRWLFAVSLLDPEPSVSLSILHWAEFAFGEEMMSVCLPRREPNVSWFVSHSEIWFAFDSSCEIIIDLVFSFSRSHSRSTRLLIWVWFWVRLFLSMLIWFSREVILFSISVQISLFNLSRVIKPVKMFSEIWICPVKKDFDVFIFFRIWSCWLLWSDNWGSFSICLNLIFSIVLVKFELISCEIIWLYSLKILLSLLESLEKSDLSSSVSIFWTWDFVDEVWIEFLIDVSCVLIFEKDAINCADAVSFGVLREEESWR